MKVKLRKGFKRWSRHGFNIKSDEVKDCTEEIFNISNGRLIIVTPTKKKKTTKKTKSKGKKADINSPEITVKGVEYPNEYNVSVGEKHD